MGVLSKVGGTLWDWIEAGYPEEVARRIVSGDLPMDEASRAARAEAQSYGPVWYRGHAEGNAPKSDQDMWMSDSEDVADTYAIGSTYYDEAAGSWKSTGQTVPLRTNANNLLVKDAGGGSYKNVVLKRSDVPDMEWSDYQRTRDKTDGIAAAVKDEGTRQGVLFKNIIDDFYGEEDDVSNVLNVLGSRPDVKIRHVDAAFDPQYKGSNIMGGALAGAVGLGALSQSEDADAGFITKGGKTLLEAWHGSPHKFDKFSMDQIGTGEGAQAYGHGLYFADSEDVAREYRDRLSTGIDGNNSLTYKIGDSEYVRGDPEWKAIATIQNDGLEKAEELRQIYSNDLAAGEPYINAETVKRYSDALDRVKAGEEWAESAGALYRTEIDVTPESLLDWDKPLSEQSDLALQAFDISRDDLAKLDSLNAQLREIGTENVGSPEWDAVQSQIAAMREANPALASTTGQELYRNLTEAGRMYEGPIKGSGDASSLLSDRGIKGIKYLDGDSRAAGNGTSNYVIFDDGLINIAERGNATVPMLATTAGLSGAGLLAPHIKDSGFISSPRSEGLFNFTMGARDLERRLEGSPASLLFPSGLVDYLETVNRRTEDPNAMTRGMALLDVLPW